MYPAIVQNTDEEPANQTCQTEHRDGPIQFPPQAVHFGTHMVTGVAQIVFHLRNGIIDAPGRAKPGIREILHRGGKLITRGPQPGGMRPHRIRHSRQTGLLELLPQTLGEFGSDRLRVYPLAISSGNVANLASSFC